MPGLDVEALLESTADAHANSTEHAGSAKPSKDDDRYRAERTERRDRYREGSREWDRARDEPPTGPGFKSRRASRSRDADRRGARRHRDSPLDGDFYRGGGRARSRSRSPARYYRPRGDRRARSKSRDERARSRSARGGGGGGGKREPTPPLTEDERDKRTIFVQQLAARLRTKELTAFFEKVGPVTEAQIVKDRVSGRSKG